MESLSSFAKYLQYYPDSLKERYGEIICNHGAVQKSLGQTPLDGLINIDKKVTVELQPDANGQRPRQSPGQYSMQDIRMKMRHGESCLWQGISLGFNGTSYIPGTCPVDIY